MPRGHLPYRGEVRAKLRGRPALTDPQVKEKTQLFWFLFSIPGFILAFWASGTASQGDYFGVFIFCIYLLSGIVLWFAVKDIEKIETLTPEVDSDDPDPELAEDYLKRLNWQVNDRHGRYDHRNWKYQPVFGRSKTTSEQSCLTIILLFVGMPLAAAIITAASMVFGKNSSVLLGILLITGIAALILYIVWQESKN